MTKIAIFYHVGQIGQWKRLYQEQIHTLCFSGLYKACDHFHVGINGNEPLPDVLPKMKLTINNNHFLESDTLKSMWEFAVANDDFNILYIHTKGLSRDDYEYNVHAWRLYLEYFTIHRWSDCVLKLDKYDCVGTEWAVITSLVDPQTQQPQRNYNPHYSGNFWWATSKYIKTLDPKYIYDPDKGWTKWRCEFWIGTNNPNYYSYYDTGDVVKYTQRSYSPDRYTIETLT